MGPFYLFAYLFSVTRSLQIQLLAAAFRLNELHAWILNQIDYCLLAT
jgi:hypothetical protein